MTSKGGEVKKSRQRRRPMTDAEKIQLVMERFGGVKTGKRPTALSELAVKYGRDEAVISKAVASAFREGLVEIRERPADPPRLESIEKKLTDYFDLLEAIVVEDQGPTSDEGQSKSLNRNDAIHATLGRAMARVIAGGFVFRDGDVVGVGSGRGVYYTVDSLRQLPRLRAKNVVLGSLTGAVHARDHAQRINLTLDADTHVALLGPCFTQSVTLHLASHPIIFPGVRKTIWFSDQHWHDEPPTHALIGVGVLAPGHRFFEDAGINTQHREPILAPIQSDLESLVKLCGDVERSKGVDSRIYCPVADIANCLFYVQPPPGANIKNDTQREIERLVGKINDQLLNVNRQQLQQVGQIMLVAGTPKKAVAIRRLLDDDRYNIRFLCTDRDTAEQILNVT